jgi:hypothetical protein
MLKFETSRHRQMARSALHRSWLGRRTSAALSMRYSRCGKLRASRDRAVTCDMDLGVHGRGVTNNEGVGSLVGVTIGLAAPTTLGIRRADTRRGALTSRPRTDSECDTGEPPVVVGVRALAMTFGALSPLTEFLLSLRKISCMLSFSHGSDRSVGT